MSVYRPQNYQPRPAPPRSALPAEELNVLPVGRDTIILPPPGRPAELLARFLDILQMLGVQAVEAQRFHAVAVSKQQAAAARETKDPRLVRKQKMLEQRAAAAAQQKPPDAPQTVATVVPPPLSTLALEAPPTAPALQQQQRPRPVLIAEDFAFQRHPPATEEPVSPVKAESSSAFEWRDAGSRPQDPRRATPRDEFSDLPDEEHCSWQSPAPLVVPIRHVKKSSCLAPRGDFLHSGRNAQERHDASESEKRVLREATLRRSSQSSFGEKALGEMAIEAGRPVQDTSPAHSGPLVRESSPDNAVASSAPSYLHHLHCSERAARSRSPSQGGWSPSTPQEPPPWYNGPEQSTQESPSESKAKQVSAKRPPSPTLSNERAIKPLFRSPSLDELPVAVSSLTNESLDEKPQIYRRSKTPPSPPSRHSERASASPRVTALRSPSPKARAAVEAASAAQASQSERGGTPPGLPPWLRHQAASQGRALPEPPDGQALNNLPITRPGYAGRESVVPDEQPPKTPVFVPQPPTRKPSYSSVFNMSQSYRGRSQRGGRRS